MFVIGTDATIGNFRIRRIHSVEIEDSIKKLGKRATLKIPTTARLEQDGELGGEIETAKQFKTGDEVTIRFGYDGDLREEFRGYVRKIRPTTPLEIECEDAAYHLRRKTLKQSFRNTTLEKLLDFIVDGTFVNITNEVPGINFTKFMFKDVNAAQALEKLRKEYGLTIYFRAFNELVVGLASETDGTVVKYAIGRNVIRHSLEWEDEENVKLKIKAVAISKDNQFAKKEVGDADGELRTIFFYNLPVGANLEERAREEILKYRYSGYRGNLTGFLLPNCNVGNTLRLVDDNFENREGDYLVETVKTTLNEQGGRRKVTLGLKLD